MLVSERAALGSEQTKVPLGSVHFFEGQHLLFGQVSVLANFFNSTTTNCIPSENRTCWAGLLSSRRIVQRW